jgi:signal transduction histidine kinase/heme-degrading monooxygenase HmoA
MIVVLSRFRVANAMEADVVRAFRDRPRAVEDAPGFLWLEVFADSDDASVFYLVTRWTDRESFERWHKSPAHRDGHALIPKGLKLDPAWTQVLAMSRIDGVTGPPLTEAVADSMLLLGHVAQHSSTLHLFALAPDATIRACSPAACTHLAAGTPLDGQRLTTYMPDSDAATLRALLARPGRTETPVQLNFAAINRVPSTLECWLDVHADRATLVAQPAARRGPDLQDELMAINQELAVLSRDRTRLARDEREGREAAEKVNQERNEFLRILAHELRQPIGGALAAMGVLRQLQPDPMLERPRALVERQLLHITRLVEDLADTARIASGDVDLRRVDVDVVAQLRELAVAWESTAAAEQKPFAAHLPDTALVVWGDPQRLQQVFLNLVGNAFKYTPPGRGVTVSAARRGGFIEIDVADQGEGIGPEQLPRIFDLFRRASATGSGLGVGLAVVQSLVRAHGGTIAAASPGLGKGSTFTVRLPLAN